MALQFKRSRCRAGSLALVQKSSHGEGHFLGLFHEELMSGFGNDQVLGILKSSLHSLSGRYVFCIDLAAEQQGATRIIR